MALNLLPAESVTEATGLFTTGDETILSFKTGGIIERIYVKEGDAVRKNQLLASLNMTEINARASQVSAAVDKAKRDFRRAEKLYADSVATREQMENAQTALEVIQQDWQTVQFNIRYSKIRAAADGFVLKKMAGDGQVAGPGTPVLIVNGAGNNNWEVKAGISDRQWAATRAGDSALIMIDAHPEPIAARVSRKSEGLDQASGTFVVYVKPVNRNKIAFANGMFARVKIFGHATDSWTIPYEAFMDGSGKDGYVFVTDDRQTAKKVRVKVGEIEANELEIISGLEEHPYLVVSGSPYLKDGSRINVVKK